MEQVRNISVLFTDLVGSTALSSSVSPDVADDLRREHFGVLRRAIAEADGTEVKNLGDGLMVVFPTASAALACAVGMQQATELDNRGRESPFGLRVGVSAGEAVEEDEDYFGDPVVEAARLCARCETGQVLATDVVRAMAGRRNPHRCVPLGDLELKGLPEPVPVLEVLWEPVDSQEIVHRVPLPSRLKSRPPAGLVGRVTELESLLESFKRVAAGDGREVVVVAGEAGLGKTTLVSEAARSSFDAGGCVLFGHAEEDLATPYGLFAEAFGHLVTHADEDDLRAYVSAHGSDLAKIVPALKRRLPELHVEPGIDGETDRFALFSAVVGLMRHVTATRPIVFVVDDLQWADVGSLQLLRYIASEDRSLKLLVLVTYRDTEVAAGHPLLETLAALWRLERVVRVDLRGLDDRGVIELVAATGRQELDDAGVALAHALYRETDGNPFFVSEVLRHFVETGALYQDDAGRWVSDLSVDEVQLPDSVREVIGARVGRLDPAAARVVAIAAVIGRDFDLELLARASEVDEEEVLDLLDTAKTAALVREPSDVVGRFSFTHALIQRTIYQDLGPSRRARAHERVAEALEQLAAASPGSRAGELAHHWSRALRPADTAKAVEYAMQAGAGALASLAPDDAVRWYNQALESLGPDADTRRRAEVLVGLGEAQRQAGIASFRETLLEAGDLADQTNDVPLLVRAALANTRGFFSAVGGVDGERVAAIDRALERLPVAPSGDRARLLALSASERTYAVDLSERMSLGEQAVAVARASGIAQALLMTFQPLFQPTFHPSTIEIRTAWVNEALDRAAAADFDTGALGHFLHTDAAVSALERADGAAIDAHLAAARGVAERIPHTTIRWMTLYNSAWQAGLRGDLEEYERRADAALSFGLEHGEPDAFTIYGAQLFNVRAHQGRLHEMIPVVEQALADNPTMPVYRAVVSAATARAGDVDAARRMLDSDMADGFRMPKDQTWGAGFGAWIEAAVAIRAEAVAEALRTPLLPYHDQLATTGVQFQPVYSHYLGQIDHLLGDTDSASAWFAEALELHERVRSPVLIAQTHAAWASLLVDRNYGSDRDQARVMARAALAAATAGGYGYTAADARAVLERLD